MNFNRGFEDVIDDINNTAKGYGFVNGVAWANEAQKMGVITWGEYKQYENAHKLRNSFSHGSAKDIAVSLSTYMFVKKVQKIIHKTPLTSGSQVNSVKQSTTNRNNGSANPRQNDGRTTPPQNAGFVIENGCLKKYRGAGGTVVIPKTVTKIGDSAFIGCASITHITIPSSVTWIGKFAFSGCRSLTSITIPNGVDTIRESTFQECTALKNVTLPNGLHAIKTAAFLNCTSLIRITLIGVHWIEDIAFGGCTLLKSVTVSRNTEVSKIAFEKNVTINRV